MRPFDANDEAVILELLTQRNYSAERLKDADIASTFRRRCRKIAYSTLLSRFNQRNQPLNKPLCSGALQSIAISVVPPSEHAPQEPAPLEPTPHESEPGPSLVQEQLSAEEERRERRDVSAIGILDTAFVEPYPVTDGIVSFENNRVVSLQRTLNELAAQIQVPVRVDNLSDQVIQPELSVCTWCTLITKPLDLFPIPIIHGRILILSFNKIELSPIQHYHPVMIGLLDPQNSRNFSASMRKEFLDDIREYNSTLGMASVKANFDAINLDNIRNDRNRISESRTTLPFLYKVHGAVAYRIPPMFNGQPGIERIRAAQYLMLDSDRSVFDHMNDNWESFNGDLNADRMLRQLLINVNVLYKLRDPNCDPICLPLLLPYGEAGYDERLSHTNAETTTNKRVTLLEFYRFFIHYRVNNLNLMFHASKLFQEFVVCSWIKVEWNNLYYLHQSRTTVGSVPTTTTSDLNGDPFVENDDNDVQVDHDVNNGVETNEPADDQNDLAINGDNIGYDEIKSY
ncbi:hypothetical protein BpHYR1_019849 [Brachionus plicatilis]|uniref:Uncharacterized protein n=1 Tax=Brachionus plicatilis TaxID=10195 RepID=A0A3M7QPZ6_BRAPC|nr:hypothetical protein BpHYR1_019849 [Brachionus plicatilis]